LEKRLADQIVRNVFSRSGSTALHLPVGGVPFVSTIVFSPCASIEPQCSYFLG
jgi:hypothetical protein